MKTGFSIVIGLERVSGQVIEYRREPKDERCGDCVMGMFFEFGEELNRMNN